MYSPIQKQQYKTRQMLVMELDYIIDSYEAINASLRKKTFNKSDLIKVFENENKFNEQFSLIKEHILKCFLQAPLGKDLRRNIAYFQSLSSLKTIERFSSQTSHYIIKASKQKLSLTWIKNISKIITKKLLKLKKIILEEEDLDLIQEIIKNDEDINSLFENVIKSVATDFKTSKKTQDIREYEIDFILIAKNLERTGDKIKGIANQIYFITTGEEFIS